MTGLRRHLRHKFGTRLIERFRTQTVIGLRDSLARGLTALDSAHALPFMSNGQ